MTWQPRFSSRSALLGLLLVVSFFIYPGTPVPAQNKPRPLPDFTPAKVGAFLDSLVPTIMKNQNIPGCGVVIVHDSVVFLEKGYGFADLKKQVPVSPHTTLFRTASVCKVVLASALMKLREEGRIDLNKDINTYLHSFQVEAQFGKPITTAHLLTHTPGFDDYYIGKSSRTGAEAPRLAEFVRKHLPKRINPPGEVSVYSNMGMALAAVLIEEITGEDYEHYVTTRLFQPLGMNRSSFRVKPEYAADIYHGYLFMNGSQVEFPFDFINDYPAGQMLTTLDDFARFMLMHLNRGQFGGRQILQPGSVELMQSVQFTHHPKLHSAMGYGFFTDEYQGTKILYHGGGYPGILTHMQLFPDLKLGLFTAVNGYGGPINQMIVDAVTKRFYVLEKPDSGQTYPLSQLPPYDKDIDRFTGTYRFARYAHNEITKVGVLLGMVGFELPIWKNEQGMLMMYDLGGKPRRMIQIEPLLFRSIDDDYYIKFIAGSNGQITHLCTDGTTALEKISWWQAAPLNRLLFVLITALFAGLALAGLVRGFLIRTGRASTPKSKLFKSMECLANCHLVYLLMYGIIMFVLTPAAERVIGMPYGAPWYLYVVQTMPFVFVALFAQYLYQLVGVWFKGQNRLFCLIGYTAFIVPVLLCLWFLYNWNLLGYWF